MQIFNAWTPERAARLPLDEKTVRYVLSAALKAITIHLLVALAVMLVVYRLAAASHGPGAMLLYGIGGIVAFYVLFALVALFAHLRTRSWALRDIRGNTSDPATFWLIHRDVFPPAWK